MVLQIVIIIVAVLLLYVRFAPTDTARWHKAASPAGTEIIERKGGYVWRAPVSDDGSGALQALAEAADRTARTSMIAGALDEGQMTFQTRSLLWGFPDHTTIGVYDAPDGGKYVEVYGRLRFGRSDLGVNKRRIEGWVAEAGL